MTHHKQFKEIFSYHDFFTVPYVEGKPLISLEFVKKWQILDNVFLWAMKNVIDYSMKMDPELKNVFMIKMLFMTPPVFIESDNDGVFVDFWGDTGFKKSVLIRNWVDNV